MHNAKSLVLSVALVLCARLAWGDATVLEYPTVLLDIYNPDASCWTGTDAIGIYPAWVDPEQWLVGPPPSEESAVTLPVDHWVDLGFSGRLVGGDGNDILLVETGKAGEHALVFITDGADREYPVARVEIEALMEQGLSHIGIDLDGMLPPFVARAVRVVGLNMGGESPGFDLGSVRGRVSHEGGAKACDPNPISGTRAVAPDVQLTWTPGVSAARHVLYLSDTTSQVQAGDVAAKCSSQPADVNVFHPVGLELGKTYYWRVDELAPGEETAAVAGDVWSFTVADRVVVDDFEAYLGMPAVQAGWQCGGNADLAMQKEVLGTCQQSIVFSYSCDAEIPSTLSRTFDAAQDWTRGGAGILQILLHGDLPTPENGEFYVALTDGTNSKVVSQPAMAEIEDEAPWLACRIDLSDFRPVDLTRVQGIVMGVRSASGAFCFGTIDIAEIDLCAVQSPQRRADLTDDARIDSRDLERMADAWLRGPTRTYPVELPRDPVLWYEFDGNANDLMGRTHGQIVGRCNFVPGVFGQAIQFVGRDDGVVIPQAKEAFAGIHDAITVAFWQKGDDSGHLNDTLMCSNYVYGQSNPALAIHLGCWRNPGQYRWDCGFPWSFDNRLAGRHRDKSEWTGRWNHWAFTKDIGTGPEGQKGCMEIYLNGELYARRTGTDTPIAGIESLQIGSGWYGHYDGMIDDIQIYDYALSAAEIAYVATDGTGVFETPLGPADFNGDERVDLHDFATLAAEWLGDQTRP